jgi:MarR family transcriptional regulator, organic hydroperoxide resistance regulator
MKDQFKGDGIQLEAAVSFWVARLYAANRTELYQRFRTAGLSMTPEQWMVLVRLWEGEGRSQADLAALTMRDAPTLSRILDVMQRENLVVRRPDPADGRTRLVYLTDRGRALRKTLVPIARGIVEDLERGISQEDLETTRRTLKRMFSNLVT